MLRVQIKCYYHPNGVVHDRIEPLIRHKDEFLLHGIELVDSNPDLIIADNWNLKDMEWVQESPVPVLMHEVADQSSFSCPRMRTLLSHPNVLGLVKAVGLRDK